MLIIRLNVKICKNIGYSFWIVVIALLWVLYPLRRIWSKRKSVLIYLRPDQYAIFTS